MYFIFFLVYIIGSFLISFFLTNKLKTMFQELFDGRIRRLEMEVEEIEYRIVNKSNN